LESVFDAESGQMDDHVPLPRRMTPLEERFGGEPVFASSQALWLPGEEHDHLEILAAVGDGEELKAFLFGVVEVAVLGHQRHVDGAAIGAVKGLMLRSLWIELEGPLSLQ